MTSVSVFAQGAAPEFLKQMYTNYGADYTVSFSFDNPEEVKELLWEVGIGESLEYFVDAEALMKTLLSSESTMNLKADMGCRAGTNFRAGANLYVVRNQICLVNQKITGRIRNKIQRQEKKQ